RRAGLSHSIAHAIEILSRLKAVEHTWEDQAQVIKSTKPDQEVKDLLEAIGLQVGSPILSVSRPAVACPPANPDGWTESRYRIQRRVTLCARPPTTGPRKQPAIGSRRTAVCHWRIAPWSV